MGADAFAIWELPLKRSFVPRIVKWRHGDREGVVTVAALLAARSARRMRGVRE